LFDIYQSLRFSLHVTISIRRRGRLRRILFPSPSWSQRISYFILFAALDSRSKIALDIDTYQCCWLIFGENHPWPGWRGLRK